MEHFDEAARTWDDNPEHFHRAQAVYSAIMGKVPLDSGTRCLDFGCGTGILSFLFHKTVHSIVCADSSKEMLNVVAQKAESHNASNIITRLINEPADLERESDTFNCIYTMMTLHHVINPDEALHVFYRILRPHGHLCIVDLVSEDGSFHRHRPDFEGHFGFDPDQLAATLQKRDFSRTAYEHVYTITHETDSGTFRDYPLFLLTAEKQ